MKARVEMLEEIGEKYVVNVIFDFNKRTFIRGLDGLERTLAKTSYMDKDTLYLGEDFKDFLLVVTEEQLSRLQERAEKINKIFEKTVYFVAEDDLDEEHNRLFVRTVFDGDFPYRKYIGKQVTFFNNYQEANEFRNNMSNTCSDMCSDEECD